MEYGKFILGIVLVVFGVFYISLINDKVYEATIGMLVKWKIIKPPSEQVLEEQNKLLSRDSGILINGTVIIALGILLIYDSFR